MDDAQAAPAAIEGGRFHLDLLLFAARVESEVLPLTRIEFDLLSYLMRHQERVVSQVELLNVVIGGKHSVTSSIVRVHVSRLRSKLGAEAGAIETVRGRGFRFVPR